MGRRDNDKIVFLYALRLISMSQKLTNISAVDRDCVDNKYDTAIWTFTPILLMRLSVIIVRVGGWTELTEKTGLFIMLCSC